MNKINDGGPAYPWSRARHPQEAMNSITSGFGMSLRDYFAAKALQGLLCNPAMRRDWGPQEWAEESYRYAAAMLAAREATP